MKLYPSDVEEAIRKSKEVAEQSKASVTPPAPNPDHIAKQWEAARRQRSK